MSPSMFIHYLAEQGGMAAVPALVALGVFVLGLMIHFRNLDQRWRRAFLALTPVPLLLGITTFCSEMRKDAWDLLGSVPDDQIIRECLLALLGNMPVAVIAAFATLVLLGLAALLFSPLRSWRPTSVLALWAGSLMMIVMSHFGVGLVYSALRDFYWTGFHFSPHIMHRENRGIFSQVFWLIHESPAPYFIIIWLLACGIITLRAKEDTVRKKVAWIIFTFGVFLSLIALLVLIKVIVLSYPTHPAIAGRSWVTLLGVESW